MPSISSRSNNSAVVDVIVVLVLLRAVVANGCEVRQYVMTATEDYFHY